MMCCLVPAKGNALKLPNTKEQIPSFFFDLTQLASVVGLLIAAGAIKATPAHRGSVCGTLYLNLRDSNLPLGIARDVDVDLCLFLILNLAGDVDADESGGQAARDL
ncbi:GD13972 [Drosophila simulans]|uniref:GD13972 n=1 Tax=Drosophila simulans TaxID=7240 RepID=B4QJT9_DROSI|nr:GD13972 [Drosophila simulans]